MSIKPEVLQRFFQGKYSRNDFRMVRNYFSNPENSAELKKYLEKHWKDFAGEELPEADVEHLLVKIHHQIFMEENKTKKINFFNILQRIAAVLFLPLLITFGGIYFFKPLKPVQETAFAEIECPLGVRTRFQLPDGSAGYLNSGSKLKYPVSFPELREVTLSGEGWFDVVPADHSPFCVKTPNLQVKVTGTRFNVIAYEDESSEEVIIQDGSVGISDNTGHFISSLQPEQKLMIDIETKKTEISRVVSSQYTSWTGGRLEFRNEGMQEVVRRLGRWYNVEIIIQDQRLLNYSFHATFIDEPLEEVLKLLAITAPIAWEIEKRNSAGDNVYIKRKVFVQSDQKRIGAFQ